MAMTLATRQTDPTATYALATLRTRGSGAHPSARHDAAMAYHGTQQAVTARATPSTIHALRRLVLDDMLGL